MDEKLLIAVVKKYPVIYDRTRTDFKDSVKRKNGWDAISKTLNVSVQDCMRLWKNVRERYGKELKLLRTKSKRSSVTEPGWNLFDCLSFLTPHIKSRRKPVQPTAKIDESLLIEMVKRYPVLYDKYCFDFKDVTKKEITWDEIANAFSVPAEDCMRVWRNLRERYAKELKRQQITLQNSSSWSLFESLSFLQPFIRQRSKLTDSNKTTNKDSWSEATTSPWDSTNFIINHEDTKVEQSLCIKEFEETEHPMADTSGQSPSDTFMLESPKTPEHRQQIYPNIEQICSKPLNDNIRSNNHNSDTIFGNYVGQYLSEMNDTRKKSKCILSIMQILHGHDSY